MTSPGPVSSAYTTVACQRGQAMVRSGEGEDEDEVSAAQGRVKYEVAGE